MIVGTITSVSPLQVQPRGAKSGQKVQRIAESADPSAWAIGDEVLCLLAGRILYVIDKAVAP